MQAWKILRRGSASVAALGWLMTHVSGQCTYSEQPAGVGCNGLVFALANAANGDLLVGGTFTTAGGAPASRIARWNGSTWSALGTGVDGDVHALAVMPNGDVFAGGTFLNAGGVSARCVARWDGTSWSPLDGGVANIFAAATVFALGVLPNGHLVVGGNFTFVNYSGLGPGTMSPNFAVWDGADWIVQPNPGPSAVTGHIGRGSMKVRADGVVFVSVPGTVEKVKRLDAGVWTPIPGATSFGGPNIVHVAQNGDLVVGGPFTSAGGSPANRIARWNGTTWAPLSTGLTGGGGAGNAVTAIHELPNGDLVVAGDFTAAGGVPVAGLARWDGSAWGPIGSVGGGTVHAVQLRQAGSLALGGSVVPAQPGLREVTSSCAPSAVIGGAGCTSSGGNNVLAWTTSAWVDATFRAAGTGLPTTALLLTLTSVTAFPQGVVPLTLAFPNAGVGCDVLVAPDILGSAVTTTGSASVELFLPNTPPLVGVTFHHQWLVFDLGPSAGITATNALQLTAGDF